MSKCLCILLAVSLLLNDVRAAANSYVCTDVQWGAFVSGEPWAEDGMAKTNQFDTKIGRSSSIVHWYANWGDGSGDFGWNIPHFAAIARNFTSMKNSVHYPMLSWQPWGPTFDKNKPTFTLTDIANGKYDTYIDTWANGIKKLGYTFYLRIMHEMDGDWYPWGQLNGNTPPQFIAAWRHIVGRFRTIGVPNVKFVWCPNNSNTPGTDQTLFFPGDDYVDWICLDTYAESPQYSFASTITTNCKPQNPYSRLTAVSTKPMMIGEWGVKEPIGASTVTKGQWYIDAANSLQTQFPRIKAMVYFQDMTYIVDSTPASVAGANSAFGNCQSSTSSPTSTPTSSPTSKAASTPTSTPATKSASSPVTSPNASSSPNSTPVSTPDTEEAASSASIVSMSLSVALVFMSQF